MARSKAVAQVKVESLAAPELSTEDHRHLAAVLRLRAGESVALTDGQGSWRLAIWRPTGGIEVEGETFAERPAASKAVAFALTKGDKPELVVQKLTEIGIDRIVPFVAERSVVRWDDEKRAKNRQRWQRIALEAAMQSRRVFIPEVTHISTTAEVAALGAAAAQFGPSTTSNTTDFIAIGPEGGWTTEELNRFCDRVVLGATILRAETAAIVAAVHLTSRSAGLEG